MGKKAKDEGAGEPAAESTAMVPSTGLGMGGLGEFSQQSLLEITQPSDAAAKGSATGDEIRDAMGNVRPQLENVKVKGHGANLYQFADESTVAGKEGLVGIIVAFTRHNSWFDTEFGSTEKGEMPPCFSNDGNTVASNAEKPQAPACTGCERNRDARDRAARDRAFTRAKEADTPEAGRLEVCSNYISLAVALPGREVPVRIRLTQSTFKRWAAYVQAIGTVHGRFLPHEVVTHLRLENVEGPSGEYSVGTFEFKGALPEEMRETFRKQRENYKALLQRAAEADEQDTPASSDGAAAMAAAAEAEAAGPNGAKRAAL